MADYIYLLQNRLTPAQRQALEAVREAARVRGVTVFLVGGAVRDLSSGTPVRDLDFAVQGEVSTLAEDLSAAGAVLAGKNPVLSSSFFIFPGGVRAELGPTLSVSYPKPGQPETQPAAILDDLRRRDFTANAMAISLNEGSFGLLLDPLNGIADMENRELRLVSNYGFIEQPALLLRAARLSERLGWTLEERTQGRYETAKEENYIAALPARDRGYELEEIFYEEDPLAALAHLNEEGWKEILSPAWTDAKADRDGLDRVRDLMGQMEQMGIHTDPAPVFFPLLTAKLSQQDLAELKASFVRPGFVQQIEQLEARSKDLATQMSSKTAAAASDTWKLLFAAEPEVVLWLAYSSRSSAIQAKFRAFLNEWPQMRQRIPYGLMQEMRITPDLPGYDKLLDDLFFALIDGKLSTVEATRAFLEPFSPPAPAPQVSPRRRPAKATRSRSKKAAGKVAAAVDDSEEQENEAATEPAPTGVKEPKKATEATEAARPEAAPAKTAGSTKPVKHSTVVVVSPAPPAPSKAVETKLPPKQAGAKGSAPTKTAAKPAVPAKAVTPAPSKSTPKDVKIAVKAVATLKKPATAAKSATAPKSAIKPVSVGSKTAAKKITAKAAVKVAVKTTAKGPSAPARPTSPASSKQAAGAPKAGAAAKAAPVAKKASKAAAKGRSGR